MALKLHFPFPIFAPLPPTQNPCSYANPPAQRGPREVRFSRWNNANAERFNQRQREQKEIEDDIRRHRRFEAATRITKIDDSATATKEPEAFKSIGTPSSRSAPSIPGKKSKYSKPPDHPAFRLSNIKKKRPQIPKKPPIDSKADVKITQDGVSYVIDGAPFEFKYSYTETPKVKPLKLREPPFAPFGPTTMPRPWTGRAPLPPSKKKLKEFDSFELPPPNKKGVKPVQKPGPYLPGTGPRYVYTREEILGEPLTSEEITDLVNACIKSKRQLNMGRDGLTHNMLDNIHAHWKRRRVCKIKCKGVCTVDMDNVCEQLEDKTGGKVIYRRGGVLYLFRGRNYNYKTRPRFPLMLWKPVTPVYPRLIQRVPEGLTLEEVTEMRKKGRELIAICKLAKNGLYSDLVKNVREAFELMGFPADFPTYPTKQQFVEYLEAYARRFDVRPRFNETVSRAEYDRTLGFWRVRSVGQKGEETEYVCRWLVVATGENAEAVVPEIEGMTEFEGDVRHTSLYKRGDEFRGKRVLVVGCGNSGMEVCLDLCNHNARPSLVVRDTVHVLPREMLGKSTFGLSMWLLKWLPMRLVDRFLLIVSRLMLGDTASLGLDRPRLGPLELKNLSGKTPVLDVGTLSKIKSGDIKICPAIKSLKRLAVEFVDGKTESFDAIILATGYKSNVPSWLKENEMFSEKDGFPRRPFPNGWKGGCGLYAVGFTKRGLLGASLDAKRIAEDIEWCWKQEAKHSMPFARTLFPQSSPP